MTSLARQKRTAVGALRHRMIIETPVDLADGAGGVTRSFAETDLVWASLETIEAHPVVSDNRPGARASHRIQMRWRPDIDMSTRFRLGARIFWIRSVADADARRRRLAVMVEEETP